MLIARDLTELAAARRRLPGRVALVPTMGALHAGHEALVRAGREAAESVAASIFVNPLQFAPHEDLSRYPRDEAGDLAALRACGCDLVWLPDVAIMYPAGAATVIEVAGPSARWEGEARPGHFRGVATVVAKLFGQVRPDLAMFGEKDWQQLQVVRRMALDLHLPVQVVGVPTVREANGLALSSRNRFLSAGERDAAPLLHQVLRAAAQALGAGQPTADVLTRARTKLADAGWTVDYLELVEAETLEPLLKPHPSARLLAAARLGPVRLLDNLALDA